MTRSSTFPATDLPDRRDAILDVLRGHAPVPVPTTALYLAIPDKRHLAEVFEELLRDGVMWQDRLGPDDAHYEAALGLAGLEPTSQPTSVEVYRLP